MRDVQLLLSEARRVLARAARSRSPRRPTGDRRRRLLARGFESEFDPLSPHLRFFTRRSLARVLDELGFEVASLRRSAGTLLALAKR